MRPTFHHDLATARVAGLHHHAARERTAPAAIRARRAQTPHRPLPCPVTPSPASPAGRSRWPAATAYHRHDDHAAKPSASPGRRPAAGPAA